MAAVGFHFQDFLRLLRGLQNHRRREALAKESEAVKLSQFTPQQVRGFRDIFVEADAEGEDALPFDTVLRLLHRISPLGDRLESELRQVWHLFVTPSPEDSMSMSTDFPDYLLLMKHLLDVDFVSLRTHPSTLPA